MIVFLPWLVDLLFELETVLLEKVKIIINKIKNYNKLLIIKKV